MLWSTTHIKSFGGKVENNKKREFGRAKLFEKKKSFLLKIFLKKITNVWMSHQDAVTNLPKGFNKIASTKNSALTIIKIKI